MTAAGARDATSGHRRRRKQVHDETNTGEAGLTGSATTTIRPPAFIAGVGIHGVLAAIRSLGSHGVEVSVTRHSRLLPSRWTRYASRHIPPARGSSFDASLAWLRKLGPSMSGHVLIPAGDGFAWWIAQNREELGRYFRVCTPSGDTMYTLLNKERLTVAATEAGLAVPRQWSIEDGHAAQVVAGQAPPFIIKPQTHVGYRHWRKGIVVQHPGDLAHAYAQFSSEGSYDPQVLAHDPAVGRRLIQAFDPAAQGCIYNLTGFIGRDPSVAAFRATNKVLQYPRRVGIGLCFESAAVVPEVRDGVLRMCRAIGFHGLFEAEFIPGEDGYRLIDFNPRYFNSMGFDVARGFPLPWLAYLDAIGDADALHGALAMAARISREQEPVDAWSHRTLFPVMLAGQRLTGGMSGSEVRAWRRWRRRRVVGDFVRSSDDPWPGRLEPFLAAGAAIRRPGDFAAKFLRH